MHAVLSTSLDINRSSGRPALKALLLISRNRIKPYRMEIEPCGGGRSRIDDLGRAYDIRARRRNSDCSLIQRPSVKS